MTDTYKSKDDERADKRELKALLGVLNAAQNALCLDECRAWQIRGTRGHIITWGDGASYLLYVAGRSARHWGSIKQKLGFCEVTQDGDEEGCFKLGRVLTLEQAQMVREALGIRQTRVAPANSFFARAA